MKNSLRKIVSRGSLATGVAAALALAFAVPAAATTDTLDQQQLLTFSLQKQIPVLAQTFTAGLTGQLDRLTLGADTTSSARLRVTIESTTSTGLPSGSALSTPQTFTVSWACCRQFHDLTLNPTVGITAGTRYAIVVEVLLGTFTWYNSSSLDAYASGRAYIGSTWLTGPTWGEDFAFKTWVAASTNSAPTLAVDTASVSVNEGTAPTDTGTFSDPDGDTVTLSASAGNVTKSGTSSGTWSWTHPASGDAPAQTVTVSATDGQGHTTTASFTVTVLEVAPSIAAASRAVSVNEGTAPTNTGTYSDPGGDTVSLSASTGTLTKTGTSSGTWSWTQPASDEAAAQAVTVTADDSHGQVTTASFTVTVNVVAPAARIVTDPATLPEGTSEPFTGAAITSFAGDSTGLTYAWRVTKNGAAYASGSSTGFSFTPDDEGTYVVTFQATDDGGMSGTDSMTVIGTNVAPTAHMSVGQSLVTVPQQSVAFSGNFTDPGALDTHRVTWNFGDGSSSTTNYGPGGSASFSASHAYAAVGTYTVRLTVTDDDGGAGTATGTVSVQTTQVALGKVADAVNRLPSLNAGQKNSLVAKLKAASAAAARGDNKACNNILNAFLNEFQADLASNKLSTVQTTTIVSAIYAIRGSLGSYNRFLEWWPLAE